MGQVVLKTGDTQSIDARTLLEAEPERAIRLMRQQVQGPNRLWALAKYLPFLEFHERSKRGLSPDHAHNEQDFGFRFCRADLKKFHSLALAALNANSSALANWEMTAFAAFCVGDFATAQACFTMIGKAQPQSIYSLVGFTAEHYQSTATLDDLPPMVSVIPAQADGPKFFLPSDLVYFREHTVPFIRSIWSCAPDLAVHAHVIAKDEAAVETAKQIALSLKGPLQLTVEIDLAHKNEVLAKGHYHAVRFIRLFQILGDHLIIMSDVDALCVTDPRPLFESMQGYDIGIRARAGRFEPWKQLSACLIGAQPTAKRYLGVVAQYLAGRYATGIPWQADQLALFGAQFVTQDAPLRRKFWGQIETDVGYFKPESILWFTAGAKKSLDRRTGAYWDLHAKHGSKDTASEEA